MKRHNLLSFVILCRHFHHVGHTVMEAVRRVGVPGIKGMCDGTRACATCHIHVDPTWLNVVGLPGGDKRGLIG